MMLDVEFLMTRPAIDRPLVYLCKSGALRHSVRQVFFDEMARRGLEVSECKPEELTHILLDGTLLPAAAYCEWKAEWLKSRPFATSALSALAAHEKGDCAFVVSPQSSVTKLPIWTNILAHALIIEEAIATAETLPAILRYVQSETDLDTPAGLLSDPAFVEDFDDLIETGNCGFFEVKFRFIELALTLSDAAARDSVSSPADGRRADRRADDAAFRALRKMTGAVSEANARAFVVNLEERSRSAVNAQSVIAKVYRWTERLLRATQRQPTSDGAVSSVEVPDAVFVWAALLCAREARIVEIALRQTYERRRKPDMRLVEWERLVRDFLARAPRAPGDDPLVDRWAALRRSVASASAIDRRLLGKNRLSMMLALKACLASDGAGIQPEWKTRLHTLLQALAEPQDDE